MLFVFSQGDLSKELDRRIKARVEEFTGAGEYKFGDISRAILDRRKDWIKKTLANLTGDENYQFGDITKKAAKKALGNLFGKKGKK